MKTNKYIKILASIPVILVALYFIPFLGICLLILRYFLYKNKSDISTSTIIITVGICILIPKILLNILNLAKIEINTIPYLNNIVTSDLYNINFIKFSKLLISLGIIFLILSFIFQNVFNKISNKVNREIRDYINENEKRRTEIAKENDMEMKIKREKAKNTNYVHCPYCGSDNILSEKTGKCKFCRRTIENKNYQS